MGNYSLLPSPSLLRQIWSTWGSVNFREASAFFLPEASIAGRPYREIRRFPPSNLLDWVRMGAGTRSQGALPGAGLCVRPSGRKFVAGRNDWKIPAVQASRLAGTGGRSSVQGSRGREQASHAIPPPILGPMRG